jgi:hypothetical protein
MVWVHDDASNPRWLPHKLVTAAATCCLAACLEVVYIDAAAEAARASALRLHLTAVDFGG